jgi:fumarate reductase subunit D
LAGHDDRGTGDGRFSAAWTAGALALPVVVLLLVIDLLLAWVEFQPSSK